VSEVDRDRLGTFEVVANGLGLDDGAGLSAAGEQGFEVWDVPGGYSKAVVGAAAETKIAEAKNVGAVCGGIEQEQWIAGVVFERGRKLPPGFGLNRHDRFKG